MAVLPDLDPLLVTVAAGFMALLLLRAAYHKATSFTAFTGTLSDYQILPTALVAPTAAVLAAIEFGLAAALLWNVTRPVAGILAALLLAVYTGAMAYPLSQGRSEVSCGCGGPAEHLSPALLVRNLVLIVAALAAACSIAVRTVTWLDYVSIPFAVFVLWLVLETLEQALQNHAYITALNSRLKSGS